MGNHIPKGGKIADEAKAGEMQWVLMISILVLIGLGGFWVHQQNVTIKGQNTKIEELETKLADQETQIHDQTDEFLPLRDYAISKFGGDARKALSQLAEELQKTFQPLDASSRKKAVAAFYTVQTNYGTNPINVEVLVDTNNSNLRLLAYEWVSILKDAGYKADVGEGQTITNTDNSPPLSIECDENQVRVVRLFASASLKFVEFSAFDCPNIAHPGTMRVHIIAEPLFSPDGHVTFKTKIPNGTPGHHAVRTLTG